jgi:DNA-binding response OmpR family regulator
MDFGIIQCTPLRMSTTRETRQSRTIDVYINYLRRKIDSGADHPLIRTIRGVGYQIGGNHRTG